MVTVSHKTYLDHMDLKNWAFSLFDEGRPLHTYGFKSCRATPSITREEKTWTPDMIAWTDKIILIIECKGGKPTDEDFAQAKSYGAIPESAFESLTGLSKLKRKVVLLYFKDMLESDSRSKESLLSEVTLEKDILIWICDRGFSVISIYGSHDEDELDSLLKGGMDLTHLASHQIEIQPDSPTILLEKLLFTKLWERAFRFRDPRFTIGTAREMLKDDNYAFRNSEKRLRDAIRSGERHGLCITEQIDQVWKLNFILESSKSIQNYLGKLKGILAYPELQEFSSKES